MRKMHRNWHLKDSAFPKDWYELPRMGDRMRGLCHNHRIWGDDRPVRANPIITQELRNIAEERITLELGYYPLYAEVEIKAHSMASDWTQSRLHTVGDFPISNN